MTLRRPFIFGCLTGVILALVAFYLLVWIPFEKKQHQLLSATQQQLELQTEVIDTLRKAQSKEWVDDILRMIDADLAQSPTRSLSGTTLLRIKTFCHSVQPYPSVTRNAYTHKKLSPERGILLLFLSKMEIDTLSLSQLYATCNFEYADLRGADLRNADLRGVNLRGADLRLAHLQQAQLRNANLTQANLWGAHMREVNLQHAVLKGADMSWADLTGSQLQKGQLQEALLVSAQIRNVHLHEADMQWADCTGAFFYGADLRHTNLFRTTFRNAHLSGAMLRDAKLTLADLSETVLDSTDLTGAILTDALVDHPDWINHLDEWHVSNFKRIQDSFQLVPITAHHRHLFQLKPKSSN